MGAKAKSLTKLTARAKVGHRTGLMNEGERGHHPRRPADLGLTGLLDDVSLEPQRQGPFLPFPAKGTMPDGLNSVARTSIEAGSNQRPFSRGRAHYQLS